MVLLFVIKIASAGCELKYLKRSHYILIIRTADDFILVVKHLEIQAALEGHIQLSQVLPDFGHPFYRIWISASDREQ